MLRSYRKELVSNAFIVNGAPVYFEVLDGNRGVVTLDDAKDAALIKALDLAASQQRGGIVRISEAEVDELKKKWPYNPSSAKSRNEMLRPAFQRRANPIAAAAEANEKPAVPIIPGVTAPANAASLAATPIPASETAPEPPPGFKPATRRIRRNPVPLEKPAAVPPNVGL